jgi:Zn-dependent M28 family amino/carboxypeptidase
VRRPWSWLLLLAACTPPRAQGTPAAPAAVTVDAAPRDAAVAQACPELAPPFDEAALGAAVGFLAAAERGGRAPGTDGDAAARAWIEARFRCLGLAPVLSDLAFQQPFTDGAGRATANVVAVLRGSDPALAGEVILVGAHHDHLGRRGDDVFAGANDNASGVTALLAVAQALAAREAAPRRTVAFVAFGAEETGGDGDGSSFFVAHPPPGLAPAQVVYMVNLDMVGSYDSKGVVHALGTYPKLPARALVADAARAWPDLRVTRGGHGRGSDHEPFCAAGIPYLFFWTPDGECYHRACDTAEKIDVAHLGQIAALAAEVVWQLADGEADLAASKRRHGCGG